MTTRIKTIEYSFTERTTVLASATRHDFAAITLNIPENSSRVFRSVMVEVTCMDTVTTATSMTANLIGIKLGAVAFTDDSDTVTITNSGEQIAYHFATDVTAYFAANFGAGTSQTCQVGIQFTGPTTINHTAIIRITYEYDDSGQTTRVKTVKIPFDSGTGALTAVLAEIGTNQVPALDSFCPEDSKSFKDIFFLIDGNEFAAGTTDFIHCCSLDAEAEQQDGNHEQGLQSSRWWRRVWKRTDMTTNAVHAFKMRVTSVTGATCNHLAITLVVTYTYNHTNSTSIINSLQMPFCLVPCEVRGVANGDKDTLRLKFFIEEASLALVQSGVVMDWVNDAASNLSILCGAQAARTYTDPAAIFCGGISCSHRIDGAGAQGAGITLARGEVSFTISCYSSAANVRHGAVSGLLILNYTSSKDSDGDGVHNHTIVWLTHYKNANLNLVQLATIQPLIPETYYYTIHIGWQAYINKDTTGINNNAVCNYGAERAAGEGPGSGWQLLDEGMWGYTDLETGVCRFQGNASEDFDRHPNETDADRLALESSRQFAVGCFKSLNCAMLYITYHAITFVVAGTVSGYTGDGSGITVEIHRNDTDEKILSGSTAAGGGYSLTWYDDTISLYAHARQSSTKVGRSDDAVAV